MKLLTKKSISIARSSQGMTGVVMELAPHTQVFDPNKREDKKVRNQKDKSSKFEEARKLFPPKN